MGKMDDTKYSYFCLERNSDYCLGISPGNGEAQPGLLLQLKAYSRNHYKGIDQKKLRWNLEVEDGEFDVTHPLNVTGKLRLQNEHPRLCLDKDEFIEHSIKLHLCEKSTTLFRYEAAHGVFRDVTNENQ